MVATIRHVYSTALRATRNPTQLVNIIVTTILLASHPIAAPVPEHEGLAAAALEHAVSVEPHTFLKVDDERVNGQRGIGSGRGCVVECVRCHHAPLAGGRMA